MLKAGDLARREDLQVKGVKIGKTQRDREISHVCHRRHHFVRTLLFLLSWMVRNFGILDMHKI